MVLYSLLNRGIWFPNKPFPNMKTEKILSGLAPTYGNVSSTNSPQSLNLMPLMFLLDKFNESVCCLYFHISAICKSSNIWFNKNQSQNFVVEEPHVNCTTTNFFYFSHFELLRQLLGISDIQTNVHFHFGSL